MNERQSLENIKVLDLSRVLAGPYCTMLLGDLGAEVIKIEAPGTGDDSRQFGPYMEGESAYFMSINRNKKSITLNLKDPDAKEIFMDLVKNVDVLVENYRPGTMEKLGLGYDVLKEVNPKLIYAAASGFGHSGPYSKRPAYDAVVQAMGGIMSITGPEGGPFSRVGPSIGDIGAGLFTTIGILAALNYRNIAGVGQKVDVAMLDCQVAMLENAISRYLVSGVVPKPGGNRHSSITPFETFVTSDGEIMIAAGNDVLYKKLMDAIGGPEFVEDPRFIDNPSRTKNVLELKPIIDQLTSKNTTKHWQDILDEIGVPNGPINTVDKVIQDPQVNAREMIVEVDHKVAGKTKVPGVAIKMSETQGKVVTAAPLLGEHRDYVLREFLGYDDEKINQLISNDNLF